MTTAPYAIPDRTEKIGELVVSLAICVTKIQEIKKNPGETNATLAMCEIAMSLPPKWFAHEEKVMIVGIVNYLYGDASKFLADLMEGSISFYSRMVEDCSNDPDIKHEIPTLEQLIVEANESHIKQFGVW